MGHAARLGHDERNVAAQRVPMNCRSCCHLALLAAIALLAGPARAITFHQIDDFESGTPTQGWDGGSNPTNQPGGPSGPGDHYLQLSTGGVASNLGAFNTLQWAGNYATATVTRVVRSE